MGEYINSKQARFDRSHVSCGVMEVHHLPDQGAAQTVFAIANQLYNKANPRPAAFVIFSDVVDRPESRGVALAAAIDKMNMGTLDYTERVVNPRTGNTIQLWVWAMDHNKLRAWYTEEYANRVQEFV